MDWQRIVSSDGANQPDGYDAAPESANTKPQASASFTPNPDNPRPVPPYPGNRPPFEVDRDVLRRRFPRIPRPLPRGPIPMPPEPPWPGEFIPINYGLGVRNGAAQTTPGAQVAQLPVEGMPVPDDPAGLPPVHPGQIPPWLNTRWPARRFPFPRQPWPTPGPEPMPGPPGPPAPPMRYSMAPQPAAGAAMPQSNDQQQENGESEWYWWLNDLMARQEELNAEISALMEYLGLI